MDISPPRFCARRTRRVHQVRIMEAGRPPGVNPYGREREHELLTWVRDYLGEWAAALVERTSPLIDPEQLSRADQDARQTTEKGVRDWVRRAYRTRRSDFEVAAALLRWSSADRPVSEGAATLAISRHPPEVIVTPDHLPTDPARVRQAGREDDEPATGRDEPSVASDPRNAHAAQTSTPRFEGWAVGIEHKDKWHLFRRHGEEWRHQGTVPVSKGRQNTLLKGFADGGGFLSRLEATRLILEATGPS